MIRRVSSFVWVMSSIMSLGAVGCDGGASSAEPNATGSDATNTCKEKEPGTEFAPCTTDSDCFSGFCDESGKPGPYCWASARAVNAGRGIACSSAPDCPLPASAAARGIRAGCGGSNIATNFCSYYCRPDAGVPQERSDAGASAGGGSQ